MEVVHKELVLVEADHKELDPEEVVRKELEKVVEDEKAVPPVIAMVAKAVVGQGKTLNLMMCKCLQKKPGPQTLL